MSRAEVIALMASCQGRGELLDRYAITREEFLEATSKATVAEIREECGGRLLRWMTIPFAQVMQLTGMARVTLKKRRHSHFGNRNDRMTMEQFEELLKDAERGGPGE